MPESARESKISQYVDDRIVILDGSESKPSGSGDYFESTGILSHKDK